MSNNVCERRRSLKYVLRFYPLISDHALSQYPLCLSLQFVNKEANKIFRLIDVENESDCHKISP